MSHFSVPVCKTERILTENRKCGNKAHLKSMGVIFDQNTHLHFLCRFIPTFSVPRQKLSSFAHRHAEVPQFIWDLRGGTIFCTHFGFSWIVYYYILPGLSLLVPPFEQKFLAWRPKPEPFMNLNRLPCPACFSCCHLERRAHVASDCRTAIYCLETP